MHDAFSGVTAADIDNDGDLDLLLVGLGSRDRTIGHLYRNLGAGTFRYLRDFTDIDGFMGGFADLDNDGDLDLVFAGDDVVYLNDGSGRFSVGPTVPVGGIDDPRAIAFSDVDGDGDLDFAIGAKRSTNWLVRNDKNSGNWLKSSSGQHRDRQGRSAQRFVSTLPTPPPNCSGCEKPAATMDTWARTIPSSISGWGRTRRSRWS